MVRTRASSAGHKAFIYIRVLHLFLNPLLLRRTVGGPGKASEQGGKPRKAPTIAKNVQQIAAEGWHSMQAKIFGSLNAIASSGTSTTTDQMASGYKAGGGGGGFNGGWSALDDGLRGEMLAPKHSAGGGGGSSCNEKRAESCDIEEGGNERVQGLLTIDIYRCF